MKILKYATHILCLFTGVVLGSIIIKNESVIAILKTLNLAGIAYWYSIIFGLAIPIGLYYFSIKKQEIIKLKAIIAENQINIIENYKKFDLILRSSRISNLNVSSIPTHVDKNDIELYSTNVNTASFYTSRKQFDDSYMLMIMNIEELSKINSPKFNDYIKRVKVYFGNLNNINSMCIDDEKFQVIGAIVRKDFQKISSEINVILDEHMKNNIFKLKIDQTEKCECDFNKQQKWLLETNLYKYYIKE